MPAPPRGAKPKRLAHERNNVALEKMREWVIRESRRDNGNVWSLRNDVAYAVKGRSSASCRVYDPNVLTFTSRKGAYRDYTKEELEDAFSLGTAKRKRDETSASKVVKVKKRKMITNEKEDVSVKLRGVLMGALKKLKIFRRTGKMKKVSDLVRKKWTDWFLESERGGLGMNQVEENVEAKYYASIDAFKMDILGIGDRAAATEDKMLQKMAAEFKERVNKAVDTMYDIPDLQSQ